MTFVSIILRTYNRAHLLPRAIDSVLGQSYPHWELLVIDNFSTDNTLELVLATWISVSSILSSLITV